MNIERKLPDAVSKKFDIAEKAPVIFHDTQFGRIDLRSVSLEVAEKIAAKRKGLLVEKTKAVEKK